MEPVEIRQIARIARRYGAKALLLILQSNNRRREMRRQ